ncbi:histone acetyltransferase type B catalytic subunit [Neodiprion pinetum]|uniref:histone acetyltransferase type B catalytic subunit n=1 Tax=Neodiprion pinetum TaxID=441929 RepID=UPI001EE0F110|nr:histone acetyltransferase type B catalytic subunit [Neodiprion pinetum]XP_046480180.1 histone acetyltransferase type B catalytic subunit [Neodiprion pinetum]XP_046480181.1 histone acetyltransferase type B catalytic subunit [Neodiprion pinetum]XP_046480182.1 histone acetyltransferase type B catalytic subunit [Neodiprion pinetum]
MEDATTARLKSLIISSNDALEFKLIRNPHDVNDDKLIFKPEMSHQVFGDSENIFGYRDLRIKLYYSAGCLETYLGMTYSEKADYMSCEGVEADDVLSKISAKLAPKVHSNMDSFIAALKNDESFVPPGTVIHSFSVKDKDKGVRHFEVYKADMSCKGFKEYHERLQTFLLWYIDAASFIDIDDDQWHYFNIFEKYTPTVGSHRYATVGFATVYQYYAYPHHARPRIAQVLVLPPFQGLGIGAQLLSAIYRAYIGRNDVKDITVEDPSISFQRVRDFIDAQHCKTLESFSKSNLLQGFNKNMAIEASIRFKINKKQARRVYEILRLRVTDVSDKQEYQQYRLDIKRRLNVPYQREQKNFKKLQRALKPMEGSTVIDGPAPEQRMQILEKQYRLLEEDYKKVIDRIETSDWL